MPLVLAEHNIGHMTDAEVLRLVVDAYAATDSWEPYERDTGVGISEVSAWAFRDRGQYARQALQFIEDRKTP